jgi:glycosyltransferase involved in cell wall biosynthesis
MRIAQIAPLWEQVPPPAYGGTELVVSLLTDELVRRGHEVTLFAAGDSQTLAQLESCSPQALRSLGLEYEDPKARVYETLQLKKVFEKASEFDLIHCHTDVAALPYVNFVKTPTLHTIHGIIPNYLEPLWRDACRQNFVSISHSQRRDDLGLNYVATVYNGIKTDIFPFYAQPDETNYLAFLGRMSPQKGPHLAIKIAKRTGWHLKMAGKVDAIDREFFETEVKPHIDGKQIEFLGEANHEKKCKLLGGAVATLFPITWSEPFGLVMAESMAVGTPVIAIAMGSTQEVIKHGQTGFLCHDLAECIAALERIHEIARRACRAHILANFSVAKMVDGYEAVYQRLFEKQFIRNGHVFSKSLSIKTLKI